MACASLQTCAYWFNTSLAQVGDLYQRETFKSHHPNLSFILKKMESLYQYRSKSTMCLRFCINTNRKVQCVYAFVSIQIEKYGVFLRLYQYKSKSKMCFYFCISANGKVQCVYAFVSVQMGKYNVFMLLYQYKCINTLFSYFCINTDDLSKYFLDNKLMHYQ